MVGIFLLYCFQSPGVTCCLTFYTNQELVFWLDKVLELLHSLLLKQ